MFSWSITSDLRDKWTGLSCLRHSSIVMILCYLFRTDDLFPYYLPFPSPCTIFVTQSHRHDTEDLMWLKHPMTNRLGPLAQPELPCTISLSCAHGPAPCGPITLSHIFYAFLLTLLILFLSIPFCSISTCDPSSSLRFVSVPFFLVLSPSMSARDLASLCIYKPLYE